MSKTNKQFWESPKEENLDKSTQKSEKPQTHVDRIKALARFVEKGRRFF